MRSQSWRKKIKKMEFQQTAIVDQCLIIHIVCRKLKSCFFFKFKVITEFCKLSEWSVVHISMLHNMHSWEYKNNTSEYLCWQSLPYSLTFFKPRFEIMSTIKKLPQKPDSKRLTYDNVSISKNRYSLVTTNWYSIHVFV